MAYNLFIAYDLISPGQNYEAVQERIMELGRWHKFQYSLFYVHTDMNPTAAHSYVAQAMDYNDKLVVIDARGGVATNDNPPALDAINNIWLAPVDWFEASERRRVATQRRNV